MATQAFTVSISSPVAPALSSPANDSVVNTTTPLLKWSPVANATGYEVFVDFSDPSGIDDPAQVTGTSYSPSVPLLNGLAYQWDVVALFGSGANTVSSEASQVYQFTISVPGTTKLGTPGDSGTLTTATPTLAWSPVTGAGGYDIYLTDTTTGA